MGGGTLLDGKARFCDYVALRLSNIEEFPEMKFDWPEKQRNAVVERCKMLLQSYGDNYRYGPQDENQNPETARSEHTAIAFVPLDHPATPEDVAGGRAIFSLTGKTRVYKMPPFPISAQRPSLPEDPVRWSGTNGTSYTYDTSGKIWQAEEVQVDGKWQRYYGFAGRHQLEKVPASEIVFPSGGGYVKVAPGLDGYVDLPSFERVRWNYFSTYSYSPMGSPLAVSVKLRNPSSLDRPIPGSLLLQPADAARSLPPGIILSVSYSEKIPPEVLKPPSPNAFDTFGGWPPMGENHPFDYGTWTDLPLRKEIVTATADGSGVILGPAQQQTVLQADLRDFFDLSRPGSYRFKVIARLPGQADVSLSESIFALVDSAPSAAAPPKPPSQTK